MEIELNPWFYLFIIIKQLKMVPSRDGTHLDQTKKYADAVQRSLPYKIDPIRSGIRSKWWAKRKMTNLNKQLLISTMILLKRFAQICQDQPFTQLYSWIFPSEMTPHKESPLNSLMKFQRPLSTIALFEQMFESNIQFEYLLICIKKYFWSKF